MNLAFAPPPRKASDSPSEWYEDMVRGRRRLLTPMRVARALKWARLNPDRSKAIRTRVERELERRGF